MTTPRKSPAQTALLGAALSVAAPFAGAGEMPMQQITRSGTQSSVAGPAETFVGKVRVDPLFPADKDVQVSSAYVSFEPG